MTPGWLYKECIKIEPIQEALTGLNQPWRKRRVALHSVTLVGATGGRVTTHRILILGITLIVALAFGPPASLADDHSCKSLQISGPPEYFPLSYKDNNTVKGVGIDLARMAAEEAGIPVQITYRGSWARVLQQHALGNLDVVVGLYHTKPREETMHFLPAFWSEETQIVMRRDGPINYTTWDDLKAFKGVTVASDSRGDRFDAFMRKNLNMLYVHSQEVAFNLLKAGRVDFMLTGQYSMFETDDFSPDGTFMLHPTPVDAHKVYMAFSRQSPCIGLADRLGKAIETLVKAGKVAALFNNHPTEAHTVQAN
ncbi:amino acid ABC transporter substrate-binding protein, PAAT family [Kordiimonas lacus]|uniref:Amino acid ABC transporter substrate-binding protein, PAAT family n=1 Tax=Kordiimonas lacus TaxID=637679 RepID=A0A1G6Y8N1_9PROT|nr:amino acid ABC transporter substrate-binding protein, PAAT family [Kordiimonas lacus]